MKQELIKQAFKLGNSAGVILPIEWQGRKVAVRLVEKSIKQEIFDILDEKNLLENTIAIFLAGSYARNEETEDSDIDVLIITDKVNKQLKYGKYEIVLISKERFEKQIKTSLLFASLIHESKAILNNDLLNAYKITIKEINLKDALDDIKRMTKTNKILIDLYEEDKEKVIDGTIYSLVLRLRELYLIDCLNNDKTPSVKEFRSLIKKIASDESYDAYLRIKNELKLKQVISINEAKSLLDETEKRIKQLEHGKKS